MTIYQDTILSDLFSWPTKSLKQTDRRNVFIQKARKIHGDRYDYDQVHYVDSSTKVTIICPKHGPFPKTPTNHLKKQGCQLCTRESIKFSTDHFISKSREIHGSKYGYDDVDYQAIMTKVKIKCPMHGLFFQNPRDHLKGAGCPECQRLTRSMTTAKYIQQCDIVHQNRYDYSQTVFKNARTKVKINCPEHGIFEMPGYSHLRGVGCQKCKLQQKYKQDYQTFVQNARTKHGDKFDYSLVHYQGLNTNVTVICLNHGEFKVTPWGHLARAGGCAQCYGNQVKDTHQFIQDAVAVHGDKYDYSQVDYKGAKIPVSIICTLHGAFPQRPNNHLNGSECPKCNLNKSKIERQWLNHLNVPMEYRQHKITGKSGRTYVVDGFDPALNTIYEFNGDFWHGNPKVHNPDQINHVSNKTFRQLYEDTLRKEQDLKDVGYSVISIWESEWRAKSKQWSSVAREHTEIAF